MASSLKFYNAAKTFFTNLVFQEPTVNNTIEFPNESGTVALVDNIPDAPIHVSNAYGEAVKLSDGTVIMSVVVTSTGSVGSTNGVTLNFPLPVALVDYAKASVSFNMGNGSHFFLIPCNAYAIGASNIQLVIGNTTGSARTYVLDRATVVGKWK